MHRRLLVHTSRLGVASVALTALVAAGVSTDPAVSSAQANTADRQAPALLTATSAATTFRGTRQGVAGEHRIVTVDPGVLPRSAAEGQRLELPLTRGASTVRLSSVQHERAFTAWTGRLEGQPLSDFSLVRAGGAFRGSLVSPDGIYSLTRTSGEQYLWTRVAPQTAPASDDSAIAPRAQGRTAGPASRKAKKAKIGVMFGFTKGGKDTAGGKSALKSAAALVITQTNEALKNSGLKVKLKYRGLVKAKGTESGDAVKDAFRVSRARDGHFDNLQKVRKRHHADIIHLFTAGDATSLCGGGLIPVTPRLASPAAGASVSYIGCLPYLVATHELGHNLGADHIDYPGISHDSRMPGSYGFANPAGNYISVMSYYEPCTDAGIFTCVRIPWFSSPTNTYNGQPLGIGSGTDNSGVIKQIAPRVARYVR